MTQSNETDAQHSIGLAIAKGFATGEWIAWEGDHRIKTPPTEEELFDLGVRWAVKDVITHLWSRADSAEVVDLVDDIVSIHGMSRTEAEGIVEDVIAALIGPRPEQEALDGQ